MNSYTRLQKIKIGLSKFVFRKRVKCLDFTIISSNCWGSRIYRELNIPYKTPFVGLFLYAPCFLKLVNNLEYYLNSEVAFTKTSKYPEANLLREASTNYYPIGLLWEEVEIHFLHYKDEKHALEKWQNRLARVNMSNLFFSFTDRDLCNEAHLIEFDSLSYPHKVAFTVKSYPNIQSAIWIKEYATQSCVGDLYADAFLYKRVFDVADWLNGGTGKINFVNKLVNRVLEVQPY